MWMQKPWTGTPHRLSPNFPALRSRGESPQPDLPETGGALTGVDADNLGGQSAASYALLSGATFSGAVSAATLSGNGAGVTNVDAETLDGIDSTGFVKPDTSVTLTNLHLTDADDSFSWENGVNFITGNDGGGNVNIRFGHKHGALNAGGNDEVFTHTGTAFHIGGNQDSASGTMQFKIATNGGTGIGEAVVWGSILEIGTTVLSWGGARGPQLKHCWQALRSLGESLRQDLPEMVVR